MNQVKTRVQSFIHSFIYSITCLLLIANIMMDTMWSSGNTVINKMSFLFSSGSQNTGESVQRNWNFEWGMSEPGIKACVCCAVLCLSWLCPTLCDPLDCSLQAPLSTYRRGLPCPPPGYLPHPGIPQCMQILFHLSHQGSPRLLAWVAYPFSRGSSWARNWTGISCISGGFVTSWATRESLCVCVMGTQRRRT